MRNRGKRLRTEAKEARFCSMTSSEYLLQSPVEQRIAREDMQGEDLMEIEFRIFKVGML